MLEVEHALVKAYGWSLYDIDRTDAESLLQFIFYDPEAAPREKPTRRVHCDQVTWL